jgi:hypothetical protein
MGALDSKNGMQALLSRDDESSEPTVSPSQSSSCALSCERPCCHDSGYIYIVQSRAEMLQQYTQ